MWYNHQHSEMKAAALSRHSAVVSPVPDIARGAGTGAGKDCLSISLRGQGKALVGSKKRKWKRSACKEPPHQTCPSMSNAVMAASIDSTPTVANGHSISARLRLPADFTDATRKAATLTQTKKRGWKNQGKRRCQQTMWQIPNSTLAADYGVFLAVVAACSMQTSNT